MKMKNIWKNHKIKITAILYVLMAGMIFYFIIFFMAERIIQKSDEIQAHILDSEIENSRLDAVGQMEENFAYSQENSKALEVMLTQEDQINFIKKLENIAQETGNSITFKIEENDPSKKPPAAASKKKDEEKTIREKLAYDSYVFMQIDLKGEYKNLVNFINKIESARNYINIISVESKMEKEVAEKPARTQPVQEMGIFYPASDNKGQEAAEKEEKYFVHSVISAVIYTKK